MDFVYSLTDLSTAQLPQGCARYVLFVRILEHKESGLNVKLEDTMENSAFIETEYEDYKEEARATIQVRATVPVPVSVTIV